LSASKIETDFLSSSSYRPYIDSCKPILNTAVLLADVAELCGFVIVCLVDKVSDASAYYIAKDIAICKESVVREGVDNNYSITFIIHD